MRQLFPHPHTRRRLLQGAALAPALLAGYQSAQRSVRATPRLSDDRARTFVLVTNRTPSDLDPHSAYDAGSGVVLRGLYEGLLRLRPGTADEYVPQLAETWSANADQSVWTFKLREGITFQDGTPLTASAALASFQRLFALNLAPASVLGRFIDDPSQITAPDPLTLVFDLGRPQPLFGAALASAYGTAIVNVAAMRAHEVDGDWGHAWAQTHADGTGTGPYQVASFDLETGAVLEAWDGYWRGWSDEHMQRVIVRVVTEQETRRSLVENGDADLATTLPLAAIRDLEQDPNLVVDHRFNLTVYYLALTVAGPLVTPAARQALCWAFPYDEVINGVLEGYARPAAGAVAELCNGFNPDTFTYTTDLDRAQALLAQSGVEPGATLVFAQPPGNPAVITLAELFQANLARIGLNLEIQPIEFATYVGLFSGDLPAEERPHLLPLFWQPDYNDAWNHLWPQISCEAWQAGNGGHYCNQAVEALLREAQLAPDADAYQAALGEIQQIITRDDPAAIYYAQPEWLTVLRRDIGGYAPDLVVGEIIDFYGLYRQ